MKGLLGCQDDNNSIGPVPAQQTVRAVTDHELDCGRLGGGSRLGELAFFSSIVDRCPACGREASLSDSNPRRLGLRSASSSVPFSMISSPGSELG